MKKALGTLRIWRALLVAMRLAATHDGLILASGPLRFVSAEDAAEDAEWTLEHGTGWLRGAFRQWRLKLSGARGAWPSHKLCADAVCLRCVTRGNANRASLRLSAINGCETFTLAHSTAAATTEPTPDSTDSLLSVLLHFPPSVVPLHWPRAPIFLPQVTRRFFARCLPPPATASPPPPPPLFTTSGCCSSD